MFVVFSQLPAVTIHRSNTGISSIFFLDIYSLSTEEMTDPNLERVSESIALTNNLKVVLVSKLLF